MVASGDVSYGVELQSVHGGVRVDDECDVVGVGGTDYHAARGLVGVGGVEGGGR